MKLINNLVKRLNTQYFNTESNYYPYFSKGELCLDSVEGPVGTSCYVVKRVARNCYSVYWVASENCIGDIYSPYMIPTWKNKTEQQIVALFNK